MELFRLEENIVLLLSYQPQCYKQDVKGGKFVFYIQCFFFFSLPETGV